MNSETPSKENQSNEERQRRGADRRRQWRRRPRRPSNDKEKNTALAEPKLEATATANNGEWREKAQPLARTIAASTKWGRDHIVLSVVIPLVNEAESLTELHSQLHAVMQRLHIPAEIIFVDDGSTDGSFKKLQELHRRDRRVRVIQFRRNYGKSAALAAGFAQAQGRYIVTMDADLQDDPEEIPHLLNELEKGYDLISGWKKRRHDKFSKRFASKIFNSVTGYFTGVHLHDINCGLKAYRREVTESIRVYGQLHRFLPVLAAKEGFRVGEIEVKHHARKYGKSKFGLSRYTSGFFDLMTVLFLARYTRRPLHLFGLAGLISFMLGFGINAYLTYQRLFGIRFLENRPLLFLGMLLIIIGVQMISFGLLGEMLTATQAQSQSYPQQGIKTTLGFVKAE